MTTVGDAIKAAIDDNWNVGLGGTEPVLYSSEDIGKEWPTDDDWIKILGWTYRKKRRRRNDGFVGERFWIDMVAHSKNDANSEERLDEIVTEIYRLITPTNVTGYHIVDIVDESRAASDDYMHFIATLTVELIILSTAAAAVPGSVASTATIDALLMYGSGNAAWKPCILAGALGGNYDDYQMWVGSLTNLGAQDLNPMWVLPLSTTKGTLKLHINRIRVGIMDADAGDYLSQTRLYGTTHSASTQIQEWADDYNSQQEVLYTVTNKDMSAYKEISISMWLTCTDANDLDLNYVQCECYYAA